MEALRPARKYRRHQKATERHRYGPWFGEIDPELCEEGVFLAFTSTCALCKVERIRSQLIGDGTFCEQWFRACPDGTTESWDEAPPCAPEWSHLSVSEKSALRYRRNRDAGLCGLCGNVPRPGCATCAVCAAKHSAREYQERRAAGGCGNCGRPTTGKSPRCAGCLVAHREQQEGLRERRAATQCCQLCGKPSAGNSRCEGCKEKRRLARAARAAPVPAPAPAPASPVIDPICAQPESDHTSKPPKAPRKPRANSSQKRPAPRPVAANDDGIDPRDGTALSLEESRRLARLAQAGNQRARSRLVASCEGLVQWWARRYARGAPHLLEDFASEARLAVYLSIDKYDPEKAMKFASYATYLMRNKLQETLLTQRWAVNLPVVRNRGAREKYGGGVSSRSLVRVVDGEEVELPLAYEPQHETDVLFRERLNTAMLLELDPRERQIISGRFVEDVELQALAERMVSPGSGCGSWRFGRSRSCAGRSSVVATPSARRCRSRPVRRRRRHARLRRDRHRGRGSGSTGSPGSGALAGQSPLARRRVSQARASCPAAVTSNAPSAAISMQPRSTSARSTESCAHSPGGPGRSAFLSGSLRPLTGRALASVVASSRRA